MLKTSLICFGSCADEILRNLSVLTKTMDHIIINIFVKKMKECSVLSRINKCIFVNVSLIMISLVFHSRVSFFAWLPADLNKSLHS